MGTSVERTGWLAALWLAGAMAAVAGCADDRRETPEPIAAAAAAAAAPEARDVSVPPPCHAYFEAHEACIERSSGRQREREAEMLRVQRKAIVAALRQGRTPESRAAVEKMCGLAASGAKKRCAGSEAP